ncbi:response regulator [Geopsychrobacter electrodiphilus]|uniref:response regulator n=1 Tax=Geopsychrobacter electrodiphilus TaxID=225196 RepID=UPI000379FAE5|nr:response regulator [Geopsychrobacter electrodiphilus]
MTPRIIVFEDDEASRRLMTILLEQRGYEVISAADPTICPLYSDREKPCPHVDACGDILLTDNRMPNMTGLEFVETQSQRGCKGIIQNKAVISGTWSSKECEQAEKLGCKMFYKPVCISEIFEWIEEQITKIPLNRKLAPLYR